VTAPATSNGSGHCAVQVACVDGDGLTLAGPYQTVSASPADGAAITVQGASATNSGRGVLFHPQAFTFACVDLELFEGQHACERVADDELGLSVRFWAQPDINTDRLIGRLDLLGGWISMYPQWACRIAS
jgi:hypothetical protein